MADKRISELPNLASIQDDAMFVVEYNGVAYHLTGKQFKAFAESLGGGSSGGTDGSGTTTGECTCVYVGEGEMPEGYHIQIIPNGEAAQLPPTVTAADDGKFLRVVNGAWAAVALPSAEGGAF